MALLLDVIKAKLLSAGVIDGSSWICYVGFAPDTQDQLLSLHGSGGFPQDTQQGENVIQTFQVRVRAHALAYAVCEAKWWEMFNALNDADLSADDIYLIQALAAGPLEWFDDAKRPNMSANFRVVRKTP